jgi:xylulose-5-phosphate/fructose-6-phosphate phosphoketolase
VRGYIEEGTSTTPFDVVVLNNLDRYHLAIDVIDRVQSLRSRASTARQYFRRPAHPAPRAGDDLR